MPSSYRFRVWRQLVVTRTRLGRRANLARYPYMFSPDQLWCLCGALEEALAVAGDIAEIGVSAGNTTLYLHEHLRARGIAPRRYLALDTFSGFTAGDIAEERARGREGYEDWFRVNSIDLYQRSIRAGGLDNVVAIQCDAGSFDYSTLGPLAFALIDVDVYRPVTAALDGCWDLLTPGGTIVVDDCAPDPTWEGAREAYRDFCQRHGLAADIRCEKLGFIHKP